MNRGRQRACKTLSRAGAIFIGRRRGAFNENVGSNS